MPDIPIYSLLPSAARAAGGKLSSPDIQGMHPDDFGGLTVPQGAPDSFGGLDYVGDAAASIPRGVAGAIEGILEIPSDVIGLFTDSGQLYDIPDNLGLGRSKTFVGGLAEGFTNFLVPAKFATLAVKGVKVGAMGVKGAKNVKWLGKYKKSSALVKQEKKLIKEFGRRKSRGLRKALRSQDELDYYTKAAKASGWGNDQIKAMVFWDKIKPWAVGVGTDLMVFDADERRLSNLIEHYPSLQNPITEWLSAKEGDNRVLSRMKNALEGVGIGAALGLTLKTLGYIGRRTRLLNDKNVSARELSDEVVEQQKKYQEDFDNAQEIFESDSKIFKVDELDPHRDIPERDAAPEVEAKDVDTKAVEKAERRAKKVRDEVSDLEKRVDKRQLELERQSPDGTLEGFARMGKNQRKAVEAHLKRKGKLEKAKTKLKGREKELEDLTGARTPDSARVAADEPSKPAKNIWEMTVEEFEEAAARGKINKATGKTLPGEAEAQSPLTMGEINQYSPDDIAHFYSERVKHPEYWEIRDEPDGSRAAQENPRFAAEEGLQDLVEDAVLEGRLPDDYMIPTNPQKTNAQRVEAETKQAQLAASRSKDVPVAELDKGLREAVDIVDKGSLIRAVFDAFPVLKTDVTGPRIRELMEDEVLKLLQHSEKAELFDIASDIAKARLAGENATELVTRLNQRVREIISPHIQSSRKLLERQAKLHKKTVIDDARVKDRKTNLNIFPGMDPAQARFREIGINAHTEGSLTLTEAEGLVKLLDEANAGDADFLVAIDGVINVASLGSRANHQLMQVYLTTKQINNRVDHRGRPITDDMDFDERTAVEAVSRLTNSKLSPSQVTQNLNAIAQQIGEGSLQAQAYLAYIDRYLDDLQQFYWAAKADEGDLLSIADPRRGEAKIVRTAGEEHAWNGAALRKHLKVTREQALYELGLRYEEAWSMLTAFGNVRRETGRALRRYHTRSSRLVSEAVRDDVVTGLGGKDKILANGDKLFEARGGVGDTAKSNSAALGLLESYDRGRRVVYFMNEWFVNSILSGIPTMTTNTLGNLSVALYGPLELMMGGAVLKGVRAVKGKSTEEAGKMVAQGFSEFTQLFHQFSEAIKYFGRSWQKGDYILDARHGTLDIPDQMRNAIGADNSREILRGLPGVSGHLITPEKGIGAGIEWFGNIARTPSRVLMATDEFFKQWTYRSVVAADIFQQIKAQKKIVGPLPAWHFDEFKNKDGTSEFREITVDTIVNREVTRMTRKGNAFVLENLQEEAKRLFPSHAPQYRGPFGQGQLETDRKAWIDETMNRPGVIHGEVKAGKKTLTGRGALGQRALEIARERPFTNDLDADAGFMSSMGVTLSKMSAKHPMLRLFFPFIRTPLNIFMYAGRRTSIPVINKDLAGAAEYLYKSAFPKMGKVTEAKNEFARMISGANGARAQAEATGRFTAAMGFSTLFYTAAMNDIITGAGPKDKDFRKVLQQDGWQPYSIKVGDTYVSYQRLDPFATVVGLFADMVDGSRYSHGDEDESLWTAVHALSHAITHNIQSKSYLQGLVQVAGLLENDEYTVSSIGGRLTAAMAVPGLFANFRHITDPHTTEVRTFFDHTINRIPFLSNALLEPQRNVVGEAITKRTMEGWADRTAGTGRAFFPIMVNASSNDLISGELAALGYPFSNPTRFKFGTDLTNHTNAKGQSAYDRFLELTGKVKFGGRTLRKAMTRLINSRRYQKMPIEGVSDLDEDSPRVRELHRLIRKYRTKAMKEMLSEFDELRERGRNQIIANRAMRRGQDPEMLKNQMFPME